MNLSAHFIDRPRLATVIAVVMAIAGALALFQIPIAQFPQITPPEVQVTASYPGANASVLEESVGAPIEDQVNGVEDMLYMSSSSTNNGTYSLTVTFAVGTDPALAQVNVQNRVALATPRLPASVTQTGVSVRARSSSMLMGVAIYSPRERATRYSSATMPPTISVMRSPAWPASGRPVSLVRHTACVSG